MTNGSSAPRGSRRKSGGLFFDWGAHMLDWLLTIVRSKVEGVAGYAHKLVWSHTTIEDHVGALIYFEDGTVADAQVSTITALPKPRWAIWGTKGAIISTSPQDIRLCQRGGEMSRRRGWSPTLPTMALSIATSPPIFSGGGVGREAGGVEKDDRHYGGGHEVGADGKDRTCRI
ncbi:MAG TPA: hypothetical protein EYP65_00610 [Armatimonadetes bacterium]|nr:hypothetical protein [Armatimonadota bacterium]